MPDDTSFVDYMDTLEDDVTNESTFAGIKSANVYVGKVKHKERVSSGQKKYQKGPQRGYIGVPQKATGSHHRCEGPNLGYQANNSH